MDKINVRGRFEKTGRAVYISHLDLLRTMQRALKRSRIPVWYSEGFNPRIYLNFPLALALGVESCAELMDFGIIEDVPLDKLKEMLNAVLPEDLKFDEIYLPVNKNKDIGFAEYGFDFYGDGAKEAFEKVMAEEKLETEKRSKSKGIITVDIKPYVNVLDTTDKNGAFHADIRLPAGNELNLNSSAFADVYVKYGGYTPERICVKRTKILTANGEKFV